MLYRRRVSSEYHVKRQEFLNLRVMMILKLSASSVVLVSLIICTSCQKSRKFAKIYSLFQISKNMKLPFGLSKHLQQTFKCHICCSSPIKPPVIFSRCCKQLLGCQLCVDQWYGGEEGVTCSCPLCRSERAYADTCVLKGLDEFLTSVRPLINCTSNEDSDDEEVPAVSLQ